MINMVTVYKAKQGGEKSIIDVIEEATPFGVNKLRQFNLNNTNDYDDNLQEIHMAIINAIKKFNTDKAIALPKLFKRLMMFKNTKMLYIYSEKEINPFLIEKIKNIKDVQICYILHDFCPKKNISTLFIKKNNELYFDKFKCGKYEEINFITFSSIVIQNRLRTLFAERKNITNL